MSKAKLVYIDPEDAPERADDEGEKIVLKTISEIGNVEKYNPQPGDVLVLDGYRFSNALIVSSDGMSLVENPDLSGSGYLTIPESVTSSVCENGMEFYRNVWEDEKVNLVILSLIPNDKWVEDMFGVGVPFDHVDISISRGDIEAVYFHFGNEKTWECDFNDTQTKDERHTLLSQAYSNSSLPQCTIKVQLSLSYDSSSASGVSFFQLRKGLNLTKHSPFHSFNVETGGSRGGSSDYSCTYVLTGPHEHSQNVIDAVRTFFAAENIPSGVRLDSLSIDDPVPE